MPAPDLRARLKRDEPFFFAWGAQPGVHHAAALARLPFEGVSLDMQHGLIGFAEMAAMVPAINAAGKVSIVRVVWNEAGPVGQALDAGAACIIAPMINTRGDAERLARYAKYPPMGGRSWGSYALTQYEGMTKERYLSEGNRLSFVFAMVETQEALDNLDAICAVPGIDGIFVGPSDLTISLSGGKSVDYGFDKTQTALARIAKTAKAHGLAAGVFGGAPDFVKSCIAKGFRFISSSADTVMMDQGARAFLAAVKG
jgi:4-hydroxy-2-oxoheptanedioate aldolase